MEWMTNNIPDLEELHRNAWSYPPGTPPGGIKIGRETRPLQGGGEIVFEYYLDPDPQDPGRRYRYQSHIRGEPEYDPGRKQDARKRV